MGDKPRGGTRERAELLTRLMNTTKAPRSTAACRLGERIKAYRHALGISQEALAVRSSLHWTFVGQVERGQRNLLKLAAGLDVDPGELVRGLRPPHS